MIEPMLNRSTALRLRFDDHVELAGIDQISAGDGPHEDDGEGPEADGAVQLPVQALEIGAETHGQALTPLADARPPDYESSKAQGGGEKSAHAVGQAAMVAHEEIHVQLREKADHSQPERFGGAKVFAGVRIDEPLVGKGTHAERIHRGFMRIATDGDTRDVGAGMGAQYDGLQFVARVGASRLSPHLRTGKKGGIKLAIEYGGAAAEANDEDVEPETRCRSRDESGRARGGARRAAGWRPSRTKSSLASLRASY